MLGRFRLGRRTVHASIAASRVGPERRVESYCTLLALNCLGPARDATYTSSMPCSRDAAASARIRPSRVVHGLRKVDPLRPFHARLI